MTTAIRCNGWNTLAMANPIIPQDEWRGFDLEIDEARRHFETLHPPRRWGMEGLFYRGIRYKDNVSVMMRLVSACPTRKEFEAHRTEWFLAALEECAKADHWYQFEKDYGSDDPIPDDFEESREA